MPHRTEIEVRKELEAMELGATLNAKDEKVAARFRARALELKQELRSLDDTPVVPYRPSSVPPSAPRGRRPPPIPEHLRRRK